MKYTDGAGAPWKTGRFENVMKRGAWLRHLPWAVLALSLVGSWHLWQSVEGHALQARQLEFDLRVKGVASRIEQHLGEYVQVLNGVRGFLINQHDVERREFAGYMESLQLQQRLPGFRSVIFVAASKAVGHPVQYPLAWQHTKGGVPGADVLARPQFLADMEMARDLDRAIISEKTLLPAEHAQAPQPGCLMLLPVYQTNAPHAVLEERRANISGWLVATVEVKDLMTGLFAGDSEELGVEIFDGKPSEQSMLFDSDNGASRAANHLFEADAELEIPGRTWQIRAHSLPAFEAGVDRTKAHLTALSALLLSIALAGGAALLVHDRSRALRLAAGASSELRRNKAFQAALQESEQRWKTALEAAGHGVWDWDMRTDEVVCSELSKQMRGYTTDNYPYRTYSDWGSGVHPEDLPRIGVAIQEHLQGKAPIFNFDYRALCSNGEWKWIITRGMVVERDARGKPTRMLGTHTDITERRAMQAAIEEQKHISDTIIDSLPGTFYMLDIEGRHVRWNRNAERVTGYGPEEMAGINVLQFFEGEDRAAIQKTMEEVFEHGEGEVEAELATKDGHKIPYFFRARRSVVGGKAYLIGVGLDISARKAAEQTLREDDERYREIFNDSNYFIFRFDKSQRLIFAPPVFQKVTGYSEDELIGAPLSKIVTPESVEKAQKMLAAKLQGESVVTQYEVDLRRKDGTITPVEVNTSLIYRQGKMVGIQGVGRDISERQIYAQALRESEEKFRGLFESAGDFAYSTDLEGNFVATSELLLAATGYSRGELVSIGQILSPQSLEFAREMTAAKLSGKKQATRYELEIVAKDGRVIPLEVVSTLVYREGKPVGVQGIGREISERKLAEELLRRSERNYRDLMEQAAEAIFVTDREWRRCEDVNQAACDLLGYAREELLRLDIGEIFHSEEPADKPSYLTTITAGGVRHMSRRFLRKDGSFVPVELSSRMLPDGRLQTLARDISAWIEREAALKEANIKAEEASRAKSEFLANMSHEIRTPMNSVIGMARLALSRETDGRQIGYLEKILMSGEHLLDIIDDILDFSKIEAGKILIENTEFDLRAIMDNLASLMADKALAKGLEFSAEADPALPAKLRGDPLRLRQVLLNFADNAIKFTSRGGVKAGARLEQDSETGCVVIFEVLDTGIGLTPGEVDVLFRPFQQSDGSVTRKYGGTGLGLSISRRLVELMGGETGVESEPGKGSKFWFRVELEKAGQDRQSPVEQAVDRRDAQVVIRNARILLAENNVFNQQVAREFLEAAECLVQVANNGVEVLDLLQKEHFDCVLMDVQMPLLDGLEATRQIRANQAFAGLPIIAVTANALEEERQRCMDAGMNDFITKPVRPEVLYAVLAKWLSRQMPPLSMPDRRKRMQTSSPRMESVLDLSILAELVGGGREKMRQLAHKFILTVREDMVRVEAALEQGDIIQLRAMGHHIKSPAAMVGAVGLAELCQSLETVPDDLGLARELVDGISKMAMEIEGEILANFPSGERTLS